ncbi:hypothetical protein BEN49_22350 [Hymenobacter coccineus]|uniref:Uncharacterized protein n=1 Tax=Hymenobacter coccineus TaxID=1908235 RepID=A0A1G1TIB9_9BACT|nr:hypothetical protein BEN49_22350 [Hymenobacter coccineus]
MAWLQRHLVGIDSFVRTEARLFDDRERGFPTGAIIRAVAAGVHRDGKFHADFAHRGVQQAVGVGGRPEARDDRTALLIGREHVRLIQRLGVVVGLGQKRFDGSVIGVVQFD